VLLIELADGVDKAHGRLAPVDDGDTLKLALHGNSMRGRRRLRRGERPGHPGAARTIEMEGRFSGYVGPARVQPFGLGRPSAVNGSKAARWQMSVAGRVASPNARSDPETRRPVRLETAPSPCRCVALQVPAPFSYSL
jgi:hypothetical protein